MNQGPEQQTTDNNELPREIIDIHALPRDVLYAILARLDLKDLATLNSLNKLWNNQTSYFLIEQYFPYLAAQRKEKIKNNPFGVFQEEYCRYKKRFQIDMSFILDALSGSLEKIAQIEETEKKIMLYALFVSNAHIFSNKLPEKNKEEIIKKAFLYSAGIGQLQVMKDLLVREEITPEDKKEALDYAAQWGGLETFKLLLLTLPYIKPQQKVTALRGAAMEGELEIVKYLLTLPDITPRDKGQALKDAAGEGQLEIVTCLSALPEITPQDKGQALKDAAVGNQLEIVKYLSTLPEITPQNKGQALREIAKKGHLEMVKYLLTLPDIKPQDKGQALKDAAMKDLKIVKCLLTLPDITFTPENKRWALKEAVMQDLVEIVACLSTLPDITPQDKGSALIEATKRGHFEIVKYLLILSEIKPLNKVWVLKEAAMKGQLEIVKYLSILPDITPQDKGEVLKEATLNGQFEIVKYLLTLDITNDDKGRALKASIAGNSFEIIKYLLTLEEISLENKNETLKWAERSPHYAQYLSILQKISPGGVLRHAAANGDLKKVKDLSMLAAVSPSDKGLALGFAAQNGYLEIVKHLLTQAGITAQDKGQALINAEGKGYLDIAKLLSTFTEITSQDKGVTLVNNLSTLAEIETPSQRSHQNAPSPIHTNLNLPVQQNKSPTSPPPIQANLNLPYLQKHNTVLSRLMLVTTMCLGLTIGFPLISAGWSAFLGYSAGIVLVSMLISTLYQRYMARSFVNYNTPEKIQAITDVAEKQALKAGMDAKTWLGYAKSFTVYATYRQMSAFNAGKKCALNNASQSLAEIAKLRVP